MQKPLLERIPLLPGNHPTREHGMCAMELVAWLAGEAHTDEPKCTCPVLAALVRTFNDVIPDVPTRNRYVRPLVPRLIHTTTSPRGEHERAFLALDCAVRFFAPWTLARAGHHDAAERLRRSAPIRDAASAAAAAVELAEHGPRVHAAWWTAARAGEGLPIRMWIHGVVHAARAADSWQGLRRLVESMIEVSKTVAH